MGNQVTHDYLTFPMCRKQWWSIKVTLPAGCTTPIDFILVNMKLSQGFPPASRPDARLLILGSMPGVASLDAVEYYAFPRNAFWKIMGDLFGAGPQLDYAARLQKLNRNHIALWDVIETCVRPGSLDSAISETGLATNDFDGFFEQHPAISHVYFNGQKAAGLFEKKVAPGLTNRYEYRTLPSTSPANAATSYAAKLEAWSVVKNTAY